MNDEEYEFFKKQCETYGFSQSAMIRTSLDKLVIKPVIKFSPVNKELLSKLDELITEGKRIGNNLNQIARALNSDSLLMVKNQNRQSLKPTRQFFAGRYARRCRNPKRRQNLPIIC